MKVAYRMLVLTMALLVGMALTVEAKIEISPSAVGDVDPDTLQDMLGTFQRAEEAIRARNLDEVIALYATQYDYHGLKKADIRKVWADLFDEYRDIAGAHLFTKIAKVGSGANTTIEVTCTGHLWAVSKTTGLRVPIDSWHEEVHYLIREQGAWKIRGNAGEAPRVLPFGTAPHPLF